ncbi:MAG: hypothetical protein ACRCXT_20395 [Paraclostridium sp.]
MVTDKVTAIPLLEGIKDIIVSISKLNQSTAAIIEEVKKTGVKVVCKNNVVEAAIISPSNYDMFVKCAKENIELKEQIREMQVIARAEKALYSTETQFLTMEEFETKHNFGSKNLDGIEVEFED